MADLVKRVALLILVSLFLIAGLPEVQAQGIHDVAVVRVVHVLPYDATAAYPGSWITILVTVKNEGDFTETLSVLTYADTTIIDNEVIVVNLAPGQNVTLFFNWTVPKPPTWTPYPPSYTIWAQAEIFSGEIDNSTSNNIFVDGSVKVKGEGDVNADGKVDWMDLLLFFAPAYGTQIGDPSYDWRCDFDFNGKVDWKDLFLHLTPNYGRTYA